MVMIGTRAQFKTAGETICIYESTVDFLIPGGCQSYVRMFFIDNSGPYLWSNGAAVDHSGSLEQICRKLIGLRTHWLLNNPFGALTISRLGSRAQSGANYQLQGELDTFDKNT